VSVENGIITFVRGDFQSSRTLHDLNGDGICDLWASLYGIDRNRDLSKDPDGDGLTDYQEMALMQDPDVADELPRHLSPAEKNELQRAREARRLERRAHPHSTGRHRKALATAARYEELAREIELPSKERRLEKVATYAAALRAKRERKAPLLQAAIEKHRDRLERGKVAIQGIDSKGRPRFVRFFDVEAATGIKATPLWPMESSLLEDVTGASVPIIGLWDFGAVYRNHVEFETDGNASASRVEEGNTGLDVSAHSTAVAGALIASGDKASARGVAYQATIKSFNTLGVFDEMLTETISGMTFSNHSYGEDIGWSDNTEEATYLDDEGEEVTSFFYRWHGPVGISGEDPEFGAYTETSQMLDSVVYQGATHLPVMAAGNYSNLVGPYDTGIPVDGVRHIIKGVPNPGETVKFSTALRPTSAGAILPGAESYPTDNQPPWGPGLDNVSSLGCAKNNLTVGAMERTPEGVIYHSTFSSRGPTDDGRIKPDLMAIGTAIDTPTFIDTTTNNEYIPGVGGSGTSYSAPCVTGGLALLQQLLKNYSNRIYLASTWKALLLNTATDFTEAPWWLGDAAMAANLVGPDYFSGWGVANIEAAADLLVANEISGTRSTHICEHILYDQQTIVIPLQVDDLATELRAMICWTDVPYENTTTDPDQDLTDPEMGPADNFTSRLMNDLDLRLIAPDGTEHFPWVPNPLLINPADGEEYHPWTPVPTTPFVAAHLGDNTRDNVEQIVLTLPAPGEYLLRIRHKGSLRASVLTSGPGEPEVFELQSGKQQAVSIVVSGNIDPDPVLPRITGIIPNTVGSRADLKVVGFLGVSYQLEESSDMINWTLTNHPPVVIQANPTTFLSPPFANHSKRYYRVTPVSAHD